MNKTFQWFNSEYGMLLDTEGSYERRTRVHMNNPLQYASYPRNGNQFFIFAFGRSTITLPERECRFSLAMGMYASVNEHFSLSGKAIVIEHVGYDAMFSLGGPIEPKGRLKYIDGCTDSLLIPPTIKGDPCLNHLHFPAGIDQTAHTHPSLRAGIVARGRGICRYWDEHGEHEQELFPGLAWAIHPECRHAFKTEGYSMDVIAYHPDSDFGPEHEFHPMINRTIVDGKSANVIKEIQTK